MGDRVSPTVSMGPSMGLWGHNGSLDQVAAEAASPVFTIDFKMLAV